MKTQTKALNMHEIPLNFLFVAKTPTKALNVKYRLTLLIFVKMRTKAVNSHKVAFTFDYNICPTSHPRVTIRTEQNIPVPPPLGKICLPFGLPDRSNLPLVW